MLQEESFNAGLKRRARELIRAAMPTAAIVSAVWFGVSVLLAILSLEVSGVNDFYDALLKEIQQVSSRGMDVALSLDPMAIFSEHVKPAGSLLSFVLNVFLFVVGTGFTWYCLALARGEKPEWKSLFDGFGQFFKIIWLEILIGVFVSLWTILFIIPGIIASFRYSMAIYIMREHPEYSALQCIRESKALMRGKKVDFFILRISFIFWILLGSVILMLLRVDVLALWLNIYVGVASANFYVAVAREGAAA
jgi:hypothetical protein